MKQYKLKFYVSRNYWKEYSLPEESMFLKFRGISVAWPQSIPRFSY